MLYIFDQTEKLITTLPEGSFSNPVHREVLNGENSFQFTIPAGSEYVVEGNLVGFRDLDGYWQIFEIKRLVDAHGDSLTRTAYCEHILYELLDDIVTDKRPSADATAALAGMLENTRWQVGIVDDLGASSTNAYYEAALSGIQKVADAWHGELRWRIIISNSQITERRVDLLAMRGSDTGKQFVYSKDTLSIEREEDISGVYTAMYGRGKGVETDSGEGYGRRLTFEEVEWSTLTDPTDKPAGQEWVGDPEALAQWGRPGGRHRYGVYTNEDQTDPAALLQETWDALQTAKIPRVTYSLDVISLEQLTGYEHEAVRLGDLVRVIDREFRPELVVSARIIELERDLLAPENTKVTLGSFAPSIVETTIDTQRQITEAKNKPYNTKWLDGKISVLQNEIENISSYVFQTAADGILIMDAPDFATASKAMKLGGGIFALANSKTGDQWNWRTFGNGSGFTADEITTGLLNASLVQIGSGTVFEDGYDPTLLELNGLTVGMGADENCTALFHFDGSLNSHKGLTPTFTRNSVAYLQGGTQVVTGEPRFEDAKFGKGILLEEGTTNLLTANQSSVETDLTGFSNNYVTLSRDNAHVYSGSYSLKAIWDGMLIDSYFFVYSFTLSPNTVYTWQAKIYAESDVYLSMGNMCLQEWSGGWRSIAPAGAGLLKITGGTWIKIGGTGTTNSDWVSGANSALVLRPPTDSSGNKVTTPIWIDEIQIEQKAYATSWQIGGTTRNSEVLTIPTAGVFNKGNWTVEMVYTPIDAFVSSYPYLWGIDIDANNRYALYVHAGLVYLAVRSGGTYYTISSGSISVGVTSHITASGDGSHIRLIQDGVQIGSDTVYVEPVGALPTNMYIGAYPTAQSNQANGIIDELRIDKIARTTEEIKSWHQANAPFYSSEDVAQLPGYLRAETDGFKVYDAAGALRVLMGSWLNNTVREYGLKVIGGKIYSSSIKTGLENDTENYIKIEDVGDKGTIDFVGLNGASLLQLKVTDNYAPFNFYNISGTNTARIYVSPTGDYLSIASLTNGVDIGGGGASLELGDIYDTGSVGIGFEGQIKTDIMPNTTNTYKIGNSTRKWSLVRATTITSGDLAFEEESCAICGERFVDGDIVVLLVKTVDEMLGTLTIPVHDRCKAIAKTFTMEVPATITKYQVNDQGEVEPYLDFDFEDIDEKIIVLQPNYDFNKDAGEFFRKDTEENRAIFSEEEIKNGVKVTKKNALCTTMVRKKRMKYRTIEFTTGI
jgi:phage minor structural protein, N-terminal region